MSTTSEEGEREVAHHQTMSDAYWQPRGDLGTKNTLAAVRPDR